MSTLVQTLPETRPPTVIAMARDAMAQPDIPQKATEALAIFRGLCDQPMPRIPGIDTRLRLAIRIYLGMSIERAAAREYRYRWHLFLGAWINHIEARGRVRFISGAMCYPAPQLLGQ
jgi:hypothetical protein